MQEVAFCEKCAPLKGASQRAVSEIGDVFDIPLVRIFIKRYLPVIYRWGKVFVQVYR